MATDCAEGEGPKDPVRETAGPTQIGENRFSTEDCRSSKKVAQRLVLVKPVRLYAAPR
jgi:hypothetical protein